MPSHKTVLPAPIRQVSGVPADRIQAAKWHILARAAGESDIKLDLMVISLRPQERKQAEALAQEWREQTRGGLRVKIRLKIALKFTKG